MTYQEIADVMDISVQAVYNLISKALMQLSHFFP
jgi:DNA-directed RNA polymerase specialized sigma24 family protein